MHISSKDLETNAQVPSNSEMWLIASKWRHVASCILLDIDWRHQAITWTNTDLYSTRFCVRVILPEMNDRFPRTDQDIDH